MEFIKLTKAEDGDPVYINPEMIVTIFPGRGMNSNTSFIVTVGYGSIHVQENVTEVFKKLS